MHLCDHARGHIEKTYRRPLMDRLIREVLAAVLPYPKRFRLALGLARLGRPFAPLLDRLPSLKPVAAMLALAPGGGLRHSDSTHPGERLPQGERRGRVDRKSTRLNSSH